MVNFTYYLSVVIINNNSNQLLRFIHSLTEKRLTISKIELIIIDCLPYEKKETWDKIIKNCQQKQIQLKVINLQEDTNIYSVLKETIAGEIIVFSQSNYQPEEKWLDKIIQDFSNNSTSIVIGKIINQDSENNENLINNSLKTEMTNYLKIWQKQTANLAIKTDFFNKFKQLDLLNIHNINCTFCSRILRELESEISYLPDAIVKKNT